MNETDALIREKLSMDTDALYAELGRQPGKGAFLKDPVLEGKKLFARIRSELGLSVCSNARVKELHSRGEDATVLVAAILDIVANTIVPLGVVASPFTIAVLLVRAGVGELCREQWATK